MRRMYDDSGINQAALKPINLPKGTSPDNITKPGVYKVSQIEINGKKYDGTLEVLGWDSHYFRQLFYTIDNPDPNPIFTRVRVNLVSPWKKWEQVGNTYETYNLNLYNKEAYKVLPNAWTKAKHTPNRFIVVVEATLESLKDANGDTIVFEILGLSEELSKVIFRKDGTNLTTLPDTNADITRVAGIVSTEGQYSSGKITPVPILSGGSNRFAVYVTPTAPLSTGEKIDVSVRFELEI